MNEVRYRTEAFSGTGERDAAQVMAFETFELGNTDTLEYLRDTVLGGSPLGDRCTAMIRELEDNGYVDDMFTDEKEQFFRDVLSEIRSQTGIDVKYALWLADRSVATDRSFYGRDMADEADFDCYEVGPIILTDLGREGALYGYAEMPVRLEDRLEDMKARMADIIDQREGLPEWSHYGMQLDDAYLELDTQIQEIRYILDNKTNFDPMPDRLNFSDVKDLLFDSLGNPRHAYEIHVYDKNAEGKWNLVETCNTLGGRDCVVPGHDGNRHLYSRCGDTLFALNSDFRSPDCHRCYIIGRELPVVHKVVANHTLAHLQGKFGNRYELRRQDYSDSPSFYTLCTPTGSFHVDHAGRDLPALLNTLRTSFSADPRMTHSLDQLSACLNEGGSWPFTKEYDRWVHVESLVGEPISREELHMLDSLASFDLSYIDREARHFIQPLMDNLQSIRSNGDELAYMTPTVKVEWVNCDEGWWGDYDPENPEDENLLRFDVSVWQNGQWVEKEDASYCTQFPASASLADKCRALQILGKEYDYALSDDIEVSVKKLGERLSWICPEDLPVMDAFGVPVKSSLADKISDAAQRAGSTSDRNAQTPEKDR